MEKVGSCSPIRKDGRLPVNGFFLEEGHMCLSQFGPTAGVVVAPDVGFVEVFVHNYSLVSCSIHSLADGSSAGEVESSGDC